MAEQVKCFDCWGTFPSADITHVNGKPYCRACLPAVRAAAEAEAARRQGEADALARGDLTPVLRQLQETHQAVRTIRSIMIFFLVVTIISWVVGGCALVVRLAI